MRPRESALRLMRFEAREKARKVSDLEAMIREFELMAEDLDRQIGNEEERTGVRDVRRVLTAGDTTRDVEAGSNAGASIVIGVLTGGQTAEVLGTAEHTHILAGVREIPSLLGL